MPIGTLQRITPEFSKRVFDLWMELGSLKKAANVLEAEGYRNSHGNPYPPSHLNAIATAYMLDNFKTVNVKAYIDSDRRNVGQPAMTQEQFELFLLWKAIATWGAKTHRAKFYRWIDENNFWKYQEYWVAQGVPAKPPAQRFSGADRFVRTLQESVRSVPKGNGNHS